MGFQASCSFSRMLNSSWFDLVSFQDFPVIQAKQAKRNKKNPGNPRIYGNQAKQEALKKGAYHGSPVSLLLRFYRI